MRFIFALMVAFLVGCVDHDPCHGYDTCTHWQQAVVREAIRRNDKKGLEIQKEREENWTLAAEKQMVRDGEFMILDRFPNLNCHDAKILLGE